MTDLDREELEEFVYICNESPTGLRRKKNWISGRSLGVVRGNIGEPIGSMRTDGYWTTMINGRRYLNHRIIMTLQGYDLEKGYVDHINGNCSDNRVENLRVTDFRTNLENQKMKTSNTSGVCGVSWHHTKDRDGNLSALYATATYTLNGKRKHKNFSVKKLGLLEAFAEAVKWRSIKIQEANSKGRGYTDRHGK